MAPHIKFDLVRALALYDSGMSCRQVGLVVGCTDGNVRYHIKKVREIRRQDFYSKGEGNANYGKTLPEEQIARRTATRKITSPAKCPPSYREVDTHPTLGITERAWLRLLIRQAGFRCSVTGRRGSTLAAHHLFSVRHYPDKRWDERHVIVILKQLHIRFHAFMGGARVACTPEDWERFIAGAGLAHELSGRAA